MLIELPQAEDLVGRTLALNLTVCRKFTCRGFALSPTRAAAVVDDEADQAALRSALARGQLLDLTNHGVKEQKIGDIGLGSAKEEDTGKRVFLGRDEHGNLFVVTSSDPVEIEAIEEELRTTGTLKRDWQRAAEIGPVEEEAKPEPPSIILTDS